MAWILLTIAFVFLLALNAFFVLAEFAIVKVRPSRVEELEDEGVAGAKLLGQIVHHLDDYLSVCQVGITLASVALGMVGQEAVDRISGDSEPSMLRTAIAVLISYVIVSGSHIVLAELVPKSIAIRLADRMALWSARPLHFFRALFLPALAGLNGMANGILRALGFSAAAEEPHHSEEELRIILDDSQERGLMSFRRLLWIENVFDFGELTVRDAMRPRSQVRCLDADKTWDENLATIRQARFTRYPLVAGDPERPIGLIHLKDIVIGEAVAADGLKERRRPVLTVLDTTPLENLLSDMQRRRLQAALVNDAQGKWVGFVTFEDIVEELLGTIRDEFEDEEQIKLDSVLTKDHVVLDVEGQTPLGTVKNALQRVPERALPLPRAQIMEALAAREKIVSTYLGKGIGMPHARMPQITRPFVMLVRPREGVRYEGKTEACRLMFVLLTPAGQPRVHQQLQSRIALLLQESDYVKERLLTAKTDEEIIDTIRTGEQTALD